MTKPCRYVPDWGHRLPDHEPLCRDTTCKGCKPCTHDQAGNLVRHCGGRRGACGEHLGPGHPETCPRCVGRVRANITWIRRHARLLTAAAIEHSGVTSEAANLAGPAADPFVWTTNRLRQLVAGTPHADLPEEDPHHPLAVLGRWEYLLRDHLHQPPTRPAGAKHLTRWTTLATAADYLFDHLTDIAQDTEFAWAEMAAEISACRSHLEDILNTGNWTETGAPCPTCSLKLKERRALTEFLGLDTEEEKAPRLKKRLAEHADLTIRHAGRACQLGQQIDARGRSRCSVCRGDDDTWHCPDVAEHWWSNQDYRDRVDDDYLTNAGALTSTEMHMVYGINPSTLRTWVERGDVARRGRNANGRKLYDVEQARAKQATSRTTTKETA